MQAKYLPIDQIPDGDLVSVNWPEGNRIGVKGSNNGEHFVVVFGEPADGENFPFTKRKADNCENAVTFGADWEYEFDPGEVNFDNDGLPGLGVLIIHEDGIYVTSHTENVGKHMVTEGGQMTNGDPTAPKVTNWRVVLRDADGDTKQVYPPVE
jgi:hypothetical protein